MIFISHHEYFSTFSHLCLFNPRSSDVWSKQASPLFFVGDKVNLTMSVGVSAETLFQLFSGYDSEFDTFEVHDSLLLMILQL